MKKEYTENLFFDKEIIQQNTTNLARLANVLDLKAKQESKYRRLKRFLKDAPLSYAIFAKLMIAILKPSGKIFWHLTAPSGNTGKCGSIF